MEPAPFGVSLKERALASEISLKQADAELCARYIPVASKIA
jgi:hypothetical protein